MSHEMVLEGHLLSHKKYWWSRTRGRCMYQMYWKCQYIFYYTNIDWIMDWSDVCQIVRNGLVQVGVILINMNWSRISVIPNFIIFAPNFFNFEIIFVLRILENFVASKVFSFTFRCAMPRQLPVGYIRRPADQFEDVTVARSVRLYYCGHDGSLWVHPSAVINILPGSGNISTIIQIPEG